MVLVMLMYVNNKCAGDHRTMKLLRLEVTCGNHVVSSYV